MGQPELRAVVIVLVVLIVIYLIMRRRTENIKRKRGHRSRFRRDD